MATVIRVLHPTCQLCDRINQLVAQSTLPRSVDGQALTLGKLERLLANPNLIFMVAVANDPDQRVVAFGSMAMVEGIQCWVATIEEVVVSRPWKKRDVAIDVLSALKREARHFVAKHHTDLRLMSRHGLIDHLEWRTVSSAKTSAAVA